MEMTTTTNTTTGLYDTPGGVQKMYTEAQVFFDTHAKHNSGISLRDIAADYPGVTFGDVSRILKGQFPVSKCKREALRLAPLVPTEVCPKHGVVHVSRCPGETKQKPRWVRVLGHAGGEWEGER